MPEKHLLYGGLELKLNKGVMIIPKTVSFNPIPGDYFLSQELEGNYPYLRIHPKGREKFQNLVISFFRFPKPSSETSQQQSSIIQIAQTEHNSVLELPSEFLSHIKTTKSSKVNIYGYHTEIRVWNPQDSNAYIKTVENLTGEEMEQLGI